MSDTVLDRVSQLENLASHTQTRLAELREDLRVLDARLRTIEQGQAAMSAKLDLLTDRVVAKLPSWWQMPLVVGATVTLLAALYAAAQSLRVHGWWPG